MRTTEEQAYYDLTRKAFGLLAPIYNLMTLPLTRVRYQVVDAIAPPPGASVLDVATGTGQQAFAYAQRGCQVVGVDLTESMLKIARKHNRLGLVRFEAGDATDLRYPADTFDITCVSFALHDMPPAIRQRVLQEVVRVTKGPGTIAVVDYGRPHSRILRFIFNLIVSLYESAYYTQFMASNLHETLQATGIQVTSERLFQFGTARLLIGQKKPQSASF